MNAFTEDLWFDRPASEWTEALPLGNGRLGAMVFGGVGTEHFQINDGTAWSGSPLSQTESPTVSPDAAAFHLEAARAAIASSDYGKAEFHLRQLQHRYSQSYLPFADLYLTTNFSGQQPMGRLTANSRTETYKRRLNLTTATHELEYRAASGRITQRSYISHRHGVLVLTVSTDHPSGLDISAVASSPLKVLGSGHDGASEQAFLSLQLPSDVAPAHDNVPEPIAYSEREGASLRGAVVIGWTHDGVGIPPCDGSLAAELRATGVHHATIYLTTQTTFAGLGQMPVGDAEEALRQASQRLSAALTSGENSIRSAHRADHNRLFGRVQISTGDEPHPGLPLDVRLQQANGHPGGPLAADPALAGLLFRFGRYLLICSSRPGGVPANLQGIWNDALQAPWSSNYTTNINLPMNYWLAEVSNLEECAAPLHDLIDALSVTGQETASRLYHAPGWVAHHNTDVWAYSQPVGLGSHDPKWAFWPMAGPWLVRHLWEHLLFGADDVFARTRAWKPIRSAAQFCLAWLQDQPDGTLGTSPSTSPENQFLANDGTESSVGESSILDLVLISDVLKMVASLADRLGMDGDEVVAASAKALPRIPEPSPGRNGMIPEWLADHPQADPQHRHLSHLFFVYPGDRRLDRRLSEAVSRSLDERGDASTGWSLAWKLCLRARLGQPEKTGDLLRLFFRDMSVDRGPLVGGLYPNLFAAHPPFQIDGNFGYVAGLAECIVQSHHGKIELLKAVPLELGEGSVSGLIARPGVEVSISWTTSKTGRLHLQNATLRARTASAAGVLQVSFQGIHASVELPWVPDTDNADAVVVLSEKDFDGICEAAD